MNNRNNTVINADDVTIGYGKTPVLTDLSVAVPDVGIHALVGPNGSGKTTLLRAIAGQHETNGGSLTVFNAPPFDNAEVMDRVVLMGADVPLPGNWRGRRLLEIGEARWATFDMARALELAELFDLDLDKKYSEYSTGQKSMLQAVIGLAARCPVTLLDEPYLGLDIERRRVLYTELRADVERHPRTVLLSTHQLDDAAAVIDSVIVIGSRSLLFTAEVADLNESVLSATGPAFRIDALVEALGSTGTVLAREKLTGQERVILDLRGATADAVDSLWARARELGVRVRAADLEDAVTALAGDAG
ncbi:ABC transporter ATP-binding protein [Corynebacterium sp. P7202]|uniref:ABC transporter ATP-binding protein n=1 Tax=Corynebacterium pygosceleis TaxID=2800406 RepID=A0A9Q4CAR3_9CORY|nr:ABC transporter ATP-binding protein [Corynebacterium pygosceleis]MCK7637144.1 ABC transporter ATP-binding protein [Corynebacterium pygosceleis]MCX7445047.1 ABC transporter ATP-binding protein [Corynebacterium pygosceleis]MCX7469441.1 ABC transporter ATP-binding protein [Corynebacterium pygosceleis]